MSAVRLAGLEHVLHFTALEGKIYLRSYRYGDKNSLIKSMLTSQRETLKLLLNLVYRRQFDILTTEVLWLQVPAEEVWVSDTTDRAGRDWAVI